MFRLTRKRRSLVLRRIGAPGRSLLPLALGLATAVAAGGVASAVLAQPAAASAPASVAGKPLRDETGKTLGVIEKVITSADGRIRQVQVRTRKGPVSALRTLPFGTLRFESDGYVTVLSQAEYEAIPASPDN
jgi:hypothetical protein